MAMRSSPPSHTVVPSSRGYWIEVTDRLGSRRAIEHFATEEETMQRLRCKMRCPQPTEKAPFRDRDSRSDAAVAMVLYQSVARSASHMAA
jgi:hypothetical protein